MDTEIIQRDRERVERILAGDGEAFDEFAREMIPRVHRYAMRRLGGDRELANDLVQTTFCKAIAKLASFRGEATLFTWLCACCRNEIAMHFRSASRRRDRFELAPDADPSEAEALWPDRGESSAEGGVLRRERAGLVHRALDELPTHYANALEWKYLESLSVREIAARLDLRPKAAESLLTRARNAFRTGYRKLLEGSQRPLPAPAGDLSSRG